MKDFEKILKNPPKKYRPAPFWSWNEKLNIDETVTQVREMEEAGLGGYFMHARGGLQTEYMSDEWFDNIRAATLEGEKRDMLAWGYDENGWPSGFGSGAVNGLGIEYQQKYLRCDVVDAPFNDEFTISNVEIDGKTYHCYYEVNQFYVDTLDAKAIKEFLKSTHQKYSDTLKEDFPKMKGFFTDEPQISRNGLPWSLVLEEEYRKNYGLELSHEIPMLFFRLEGYEGPRFRFWKLVRDLFAESFMKQIYAWCKENNTDLTGHMVLEEMYYDHILANGCCMPSYEYMDIPGMDHLGKDYASIQTEMQVTSVANQFGKKQILSETYAGCGWNVSFEHLRKMYEQQLVHGINYLCQHLEGYTLRGIRKRDYPASLFKYQPWWKHYRAFNDIVSRIGMLIAEGTVNFEILVLNAIESGWITIDDIGVTNDYAQKMIDVMNVLENSQLQYHLTESSIVERHAKVENGKLIIGSQSYSVIIVPSSLCLDRAVFNLFTEFKNQGGKLIFVGEIPYLIDGIKTDEVKALAADCKVATPKDVLEFIPTEPAFKVYSKDSTLVSTYRRFEEMGMTMYYICNLCDQENTIKIGLKGESVCRFNPENGETEAVFYEKADGEILMETTIVANSSVIYFVYNDDSCKPAPFIAANTNEISLVNKLKGEWKIDSADDNSITLDYCDLFVDGEKIAENLPISDVQEMLCAYEKKVSAKVVFKFFVKDLSFSRLDLVVETPEIFEILLNGNKIEKNIKGYWKDISFKVIDIFSSLKQGENELVLSCDFVQSEKIYQNIKNSLLFESEKNKLTYDMEIEAIYLKGDFGVYTDEGFVVNEANNLQTKGNFYLSSAKETVVDTALALQGFPFFAGSITLSKKIMLTPEEAENAVIAFAKLPATVTEITVNGKDAGKVMWHPYKVNVSDLTCEGENEIKITLTGSLRNTMGPFHLNNDDPNFIGPGAFFHNSRLWSNGLNDDWTDTYSFIQNGLFFAE